MSNRYDDARHRVRQFLTLGDTLGFELAGNGTNAADVELFRFRVPRAINVDEASVVFMSAATVATANLQVLELQKAAQGTGSATAFGSYQTAGTTADSTGAVFTVTATDFAAGDHLVLAVAAGTHATDGWLAQVLIGWKEDFPSSEDDATGR